MNKGILIALCAGIAALAGLQLYTLSSVQSIETRLAAVESQQAAVERSLSEQIEQRSQIEAERVAEQQQAIEEMRAEVERAHQAANGAAGKVREEAQQRYETLAARLRQAEQELEQGQARLSNELSGVRQASSAAQSGVSSVENKVEQVESQVQAARSQLNSAVADLKQTQGDLGKLSGLIATNSEQIDALRTIGDREYTEFTLFKRNDPVPLGGISVLLKKTDVDGQRYSIDLFINDRKVEKKDRVINEPLQFYMGDRREPYELVVNEVRKDEIVGYLAAPKADNAAASPTPGSGAR